MDYVVGSVAALISGNVTPSRPKIIRRALTPTKHPQSPNVTPKSELVDNRSIFLSPSVQKKKAIVKKSPKRIFQNPDADTTLDEGNNSLTSPVVDKVKKHLNDQLDSENTQTVAMAISKSPKNKLNKSKESISPKENKSADISVDIVPKSNENTPKKKKRKSIPSANTENVEVKENSEDVPEIKSQDVSVKKSPMKRKRSKSTHENVEEEEKENLKAAENTNKENESKNENVTENVTENKKKKNKRRKKKPKNNQQNKEIEANKSEENKQDVASEEPPAKKSKSKKKNKKASNQGNVNQDQEKMVETNQEAEDSKAENVKEECNAQKSKKKSKKASNQVNTNEEQVIVNPNAITNEETDSEHESDDDIQSEDENKEALAADPAESSDEEEDQKASKKEKVKPQEAEPKEDHVATEDEIRRTLFVGNVPFSKKCKKEIKNLFNKYGEIETVRIRTIPVKDASVTPKLAVIKNELHPERTTVNVYIKFKYEDSVNQALSANNTVMNEHHLRVTRSDTSGSAHDPKCAVFVGNIPFALEDEGLRAKFEKCGEIESVRIVRDKKTNAGKGFGYVNFASKDGVELALVLTEEDLTIKNRIMRVKRCTPAQSSGKKVSNVRENAPNRRGNGSNMRGNGQNMQRNGPNMRGNGPNMRGNGPNMQRNGPNMRGNGPNMRGNGQNMRGNWSNGPGNRGNMSNQRGFNKNGQGEEETGAFRRIMNKRKFQDGGDGPREKKPRKEFVGMTGEKKKKQKFNKGQKKKKALSEILTK